MLIGGDLLRDHSQSDQWPMPVESSLLIVIQGKKGSMKVVDRVVEESYGERLDWWRSQLIRQEEM